MLDGILSRQYYIRLLRDNMLPCGTGVLDETLCMSGTEINFADMEKFFVLSHKM